MTETVTLLLIVAWLESIALAFAAGWLWRGAIEEKTRHSNGLIADLEDAMAGNGRALWETHELLDQVRGWLVYIESSLETKEQHLEISRKKMGKIRNRPFDGSDRDQV